MFMVAQSEAGVGRTDAEYARWDSELKRIQQLASNGSVTPKLAEETASKFQAAEAARKEALANIDSAKARQREAEANVLTAQADIQAAKAKLIVARSEIAQAETMLTYAELVSPFDGFVTSRRVDTGHYVQPAGANNAQPLMTIANVSRVRVFVNVPESEAAWVDAGFGEPDSGDLVTIMAPSLPSGKIESRVTRTSLQLDSQSRTLSAEVDLENSELKMLPGAYVTTKILLEQRENVLTLPIGAVLKANDHSRCCVVIDGKIQHRPIELGLRVGDEVEIVSGLDGSESVVLLRASSLQAGQPVEIIAKK
jgi:RND family efflux transporter MFP subunit